MKFNAKVTSKDIWISGLNKYLKTDLDIEDSADLTVEYHIELFLKSIGISSISITIDIIYGTIIWEDEKYNEGEIKLDIKPLLDDKWKVINEMEFKEDGELYVNNIEIDFGDYTINIS